MQWEKLGRIYNPEDHADAYGMPMKYGANPVAMPLEGDAYRIFYNVRDEKNRSYITSLDYDLERKEILSVSGKILTGPGELGAFDDSGCSLGCVLDMGDTCYLYYLGWNLPKNIPFMNSIGAAVYDKKTEKCEKLSAGPIMGRSDVDPFSLSYPFVLKVGDKFQMWYGSHISWRDTTPERYHFLHVLKYAFSEDAVHFLRKGGICVQGDGEVEYAFARPSVLYENGLYRMWYTWRGEKYRIGYAESLDGVRWTRKDEEAEIEPDAAGWENGEICYPMVFRHKGRLHMLYCGKRYGMTGFGLARAVDEDVKYKNFILGGGSKTLLLIQIYVSLYVLRPSSERGCL